MLQELNRACPPFVKGGNYVGFLWKSPFSKGGFRGIKEITVGRNFWQTLFLPSAGQKDETIWSIAGPGNH
jgi:hypothetical protein